MEHLSNFLLAGSFIWIAWQDLKSRKVYLFGYGIIYILYTVKLSFLDHPAMNLIWINLMIIFILATSLALYYLLRYRNRMWSRMKVSIGPGDLLLVPVLAAAFSTGNFVLFLILSCLAALCYSLFNQQISKTDTTIPLAGIQSLLLSILLVLESAGFWSFRNDLILP